MRYLNDVLGRCSGLRGAKRMIYYQWDGQHWKIVSKPVQVLDHLSKEDTAGCSLDNAGYDHVNIFADEVDPLFNNNHRSVI